MQILYTIVPIFTIIGLGWVVRKKGFIEPAFVGPANKLVYYLAIPAMIFQSIAGTPLKTQFDGLVLGITLCSVFMVFIFAWCLGIWAKIDRKWRGSFIQSSFHGNLGYIGLAVAFYYLGSDGLARASIIAGFIMILQNFLAVVALQFYSQTHRSKGSGRIRFSRF